MRTTRFASTLVEVMLAAAVCATVLGAAGMGYVAVVKRASQDATRSAVTLQASALAEDLTRMIRKASDATIDSSKGNKNLVLSLPDGPDDDGDGIPDTTEPSGVASDGSLVYEDGPQVTYYWSDLTGKASSGSVYWRRIAQPSGADDVDPNWSLVNGQARWNCLESADFSIDDSNGTVTFTIVCSSLNRGERQATGSEQNSAYSRVTLTRTVAMRSGN